MGQISDKGRMLEGEPELRFVLSDDLQFYNCK